MTRQQVLDTLEEVISLLGTYDITTIRASMGMYLCCKAIHEQTDIRVLADRRDQRRAVRLQVHRLCPLPRGLPAGGQEAGG